MSPESASTEESVPTSMPTAFSTNSKDDKAISVGAVLVEIGAGVGVLELLPPPPPPQAATINAIRLADANFGFLNFILFISLDK